MKAFIMLGLALILGLVAVSSAATMVSVSGSTSLLPLAERWAEEFNQMQSDYEVSVRAGGFQVLASRTWPPARST